MVGNTHLAYPRLLAGLFASVEVRLNLLEHRFLSHRHLVTPFGILGAFLNALFDRIKICEHKLGGDRFDIADGINRSGDVMNVSILEAADHLNDGIDFAYVT